MESQEAYFHIVRQSSSLQAVARLLYGGTDSPAARDFLRLNEVAADSSGYLAAGRIVYIPDTVCLAPSLEAQIIEMVKRCNELMSARLSASQARLLARHSNLINNAAGHSSMIRSVPGMVGKAAGGMLAAAQVEMRLMGDKLKELEALYKKSFQVHGGRLGPKFYAQRRRIYESLDTAAGRLARAITFGTRLDEKTRHALKVNTKSQLLHWRRRGTGGHLRDFEAHFDRMGRVTRHLDHAGYLLIGIDAYLTADAIAKACEVGDDRHCHRAMVVKGGGFAGSTGGSALGSIAAYGVCNALFGLESLGSSVLWCGLVLGATASIVGGAIGGGVGKTIGKKVDGLVFENTYSAHQP